MKTKALLLLALCAALMAGIAIADGSEEGVLSSEATFKTQTVDATPVVPTEQAIGDVFEAGICSATQNCAGGCPSVSCSGSSNCRVGSNWVECDGNRTYCQTNCDPCPGSIFCSGYTICDKFCGYIGNECWNGCCVCL